MSKITTLDQFIVKKQADFAFAGGELSQLLSSIQLASKIVSREVNKAGLAHHILGSAGKENVQGEDQQNLDVFADDQFIAAFKAQGEVCGVASEENDHFIAFDEETCQNGKYVILIDPLDGSSNIDVNVSIGTIFSIYRRITPVGTKAQKEDFLQPGIRQVVAGYVIYGSSTMLVYTTGAGVNGFTFDLSIGVFCLSHPNMQIPVQGKIYSVNEGNFHAFTNEGVREYIRWCQSVNPNEGKKPYTARYIGSLVADFHRNLIKGGVYLYPATQNAPEGKLRLNYECNPMAFLIEQAGGKATDGKRRIMEITPGELHERVPLIIGSKEMVEDVENRMNQHAEVSA